MWTLQQQPWLWNRCRVGQGAGRVRGTRRSKGAGRSMGAGRVRVQGRLGVQGGPGCGVVQGAGQVRVWDRSGMRGKPGAHCGLQDLKPREQQRPACVQSISRPLQLSPELVPQPREAPAQAPLWGGCSPNTPTPASVLHVAGPDLRQPTLASQHPCGIRAVAVCTSHERKLRPGGRGACWGRPHPGPRLGALLLPGGPRSPEPAVRLGAWGSRLLRLLPWGPSGRPCSCSH